MSLSIVNRITDARESQLERETDSSSPSEPVCVVCPIPYLFTENLKRISHEGHYAFVKKYCGSCSNSTHHLDD